MSENDIPQWAHARATKLAGAEPASTGYAFATAFARYIAQHEEPPVDPLLIEARQIAANARQANWATRAASLQNSVAVKIAGGGWDDHMLVTAAHEALRRGIELAKAQP